MSGPTYMLPRQLGQHDGVLMLLEEWESAKVTVRTALEDNPRSEETLQSLILGFCVSIAVLDKKKVHLLQHAFVCLVARATSLQ